MEIHPIDSCRDLKTPIVDFFLFDPDLTKVFYLKNKHFQSTVFARDIFSGALLPQKYLGHDDFNGYRITDGIAISENGKVLFGKIHDGETFVWDVDTGDILLKDDFRKDTPAPEFIFNHDGTRLGIFKDYGGLEGFLKVYSLPDGKILFDGRSRFPFGFDATGNWIFTEYSFLGPLGMWNYSTGEKIDLGGSTPPWKSFFAQSPDGQTLISLEEAFPYSINRWSVPNRQALPALTDKYLKGRFKGSDRFLSFSPDFKFLRSSPSTVFDMEQQSTVLVVQEETGREPLTSRISRDGKFFGIIYGNGLVRLYQIGTWELVHQRCLEVDTGI